jgi:hypothetical protein
MPTLAFVRINIGEYAFAWIPACAGMTIPD